MMSADANEIEQTKENYLSAADERMHLCRVLAKLDDTLFFLKIEKITCFVQFWGLFILDLEVIDNNVKPVHFVLLAERFCHRFSPSCPTLTIKRN